MDRFLASPKAYYGFLIFLLLLTLLPVLLYINTCSIRVWDEGRQAVNATMMFLNKNYLITYFEGKPDFWNTKPLLLIWLQVLGLKLFGIGEVGLRIPSALAAMLTVSLLFWFGWQKLQKPLIGILSALVLISTRGYVAQHVILTGDFDALLTFFITAYSLFFFLYLETFRKKYWVAVTIALILGALTKSVAALLPLPGLIAYALLSRKFLPLLKRKEIYLGMLSFVAVMAAYYFSREQVQPGYWQAVQDNELGGRFLKTLEEHDRPWYFYLTGDKFMPWLLLIIPAIFVAYKFAEGIIRRFAFFASLFFFGFLITISVSKTKLLWYAVPLYPMGGLLVAIGFYYTFQWATKRYQMAHPNRFVLISLVLIFGIFYGIVVGRVASQPRKDKTDMLAADAYFMKNFHREFPELKNYTFISQEGYNSSLDFYLLKFRQEGYTIQDKRELHIQKDYCQLRNLPAGALILCCNPDLISRLKAAYELKEVKTQDAWLAARIVREK